jgi:hypothetical protein
VSSIEKVLLKFEKTLPSTAIKTLPVTEEVVKDPEGMLQKMISSPDDPGLTQAYERLVHDEKELVKEYIMKNRAVLADKTNIPLTPSRIDLIADVYTTSTCDINAVMEKIQTYYGQIKKVEAYFHKTHDINISLEEDAIDVILLGMFSSSTALGDLYKKLTNDFEYGFKLIRDRVGQDRIMIPLRNGT